MQTGTSVAVSSAVLFLAGVLGGAEPTIAQTCQDELTCQFLACRSPATSVPSALWGELRPATPGQVPPRRDNTNFNEFTTLPGPNEPFWMSLDVENGWVFAGIGQGLEIWNARANPAKPTRVALVGPASFPTWGLDPHFREVVQDVDAPDGFDMVVAVALGATGGLAVFDTTQKGGPYGKYADLGKNAEEVYATRIGSINYSFTATRGAGLLVHNLTNARALSLTCRESTPAEQVCGVYEGRVGSRDSIAYVDGAGTADGRRHWVVASGGGYARGLDVWEVTRPGSPSRVLSGLATEFVHGVALWRGTGGGLYLATRVMLTSAATEARIYDLTCLASGCSALPAPIWTATMPTGGSRLPVTDSSSGSRDFVYFGTVNQCAQGPQAEWLFDVTSPGSPRDVTPPGGYWGWYYRRNPTGFNRISPRMGKFVGRFFYRTAYSLFDIHELTTPP